MVHDRYLESCKKWHVKPNSQALVRIRSADVSIGLDGKPSSTYDFGMAHLGDRGVVCALHALARDPRCAVVSFRECNLHANAAPVMAVFLELHPRLTHADLADN